MASKIVTVNGRQKRVFVLGGKNYLAPVFIGAGYQDTVGQHQLDLMMNDIAFATRLSKMNPKNQVESNNLLNTLTTEYALAHPVDYKVAILSALLKPEDGSVLTVEEWKEFYMEEFSPAEVDEVLNFFTQTLSGKTNADSSNKKRGDSSKVKK